MQTVTINQRVLPAVGLGTWHMGDDPVKHATEVEALQAGIKAGAQVIDTAEMYGNGRAERLVAEAIKPFNRKNLFIIDKVLPQNASRAQLEKSLDRSLKNVGIDYFDLYLLHWRGQVPLAETIAELERVKQAGKIRAWGVSNFDVADLKELYALPNGGNCAANEDLYNLDRRGIEYDLLAWQKDQGLPLIAYSPVAQGDTLSGRLTADPTLQKLADRHHATVYQIMLAWTIRCGNTLTIPQTGNPEHARQNVAAGELEFSDAELLELERAFPSPRQKQPLATI
ncbi:aldo/keto reductase [Limosilactobacillus mucosae]|uniref:aldo/keto reductase n=1 Tax=Limosilactobacillus mucosae TaxID=97478 RepID=UPI0039963338